jgi:hypothetical protein
VRGEIQPAEVYMEKIEKTLDEWRSMLDRAIPGVPPQGTERPFSGKYNSER